mmetsp:Transcript_17788/g.45574  ORF Transcript_17788/g.45574 Transcript_17788/m.45574 type:complete len:582 (-) Transcript_17788:36-1781(-)
MADRHARVVAVLEVGGGDGHRVARRQGVALQRDGHRHDGGRARPPAHAWHDAVRQLRRQRRWRRHRNGDVVRGAGADEVDVDAHGDGGRAVAAAPAAAAMLVQHGRHLRAQLQPLLGLAAHAARGGADDRQQVAVLLVHRDVVQLLALVARRHIERRTGAEVGQGQRAGVAQADHQALQPAKLAHAQRDRHVVAGGAPHELRLPVHQEVGGGGAQDEVLQWPAAVHPAAVGVAADAGGRVVQPLLHADLALLRQDVDVVLPQHQDVHLRRAQPLREVHRPDVQHVLAHDHAPVRLQLLGLGERGGRPAGGLGRLFAGGGRQHRELVALQHHARVGCHEGVSVGHIGERAGEKEVRQEALKGDCLALEEAQLAVQRLHADALHALLVAEAAVAHVGGAVLQVVLVHLAQVEVRGAAAAAEDRGNGVDRHAARVQHRQRGAGVVAGEVAGRELQHRAVQLHLQHLVVHRVVAPGGAKHAQHALQAAGDHLERAAGLVVDVGHAQAAHVKLLARAGRRAPPLAALEQRHRALLPPPPLRSTPPTLRQPTSPTRCAVGKILRWSSSRTPAHQVALGRAELLEVHV